MAHDIPTSNGGPGFYTTVVVPIRKVDDEWTAACSVSVDNRGMSNRDAVAKTIAIAKEVEGALEQLRRR